MDDLKQNIRKWNHDILTHMIGITYLMDMQRYPEAERYCEKILNSLSSFSETFRTRATSPDPDSVSESPVPTDYLPEGFIEYQEKLPAEITAFQTLLQQKKYPEAAVISRKISGIQETVRQVKVLFRKERYRG